MKYLIGMTIAIFITVGSLQAQTPKGLKGPAAKNYKPWQNKSKDDSRTPAVSFPTKETLKGPEAKNHKPWNDAREMANAVQISVSKQKLKGPAAKNQKPWQD